MEEPAPDQPAQTCLSVVTVDELRRISSRSDLHLLKSSQSAQPIRSEQVSVGKKTVFVRFLLEN